MAKAHSRHKEYSLILAAAVAALLFFTGKAESMGMLVLLNTAAIAAILWSAFSVVRHADVLAHRFGEPYGSLILSLSIVVLEVSLISILMLSGSAGEHLMRDTVYAVIMIVMAGLVGFALLLGGWKYKTQNYNFTGINHFLISILPLAVIVFVLSNAMPGGGFNGIQYAIIAVLCLAMYGVFLHVQTKTHRQFFIYEAEDEDEDHHGKPSSHSSAWHAVFLIVHLVAVIGITKLNAKPLELFLLKLNMPAEFTGFLVALLILTPEGLGAFSSILKNQVQRAMNLLLGSVIATISLTVPVVVFIAAITGQSISTGLDLPTIIVMATTLGVCQTSLTSGLTTAPSGAAHIVLLVTYTLLMFRYTLLFSCL